MLKFAAIPFIIGVYILLSMIKTQLKKWNSLHKLM
jgi:hypothetical protein